MFDYSPLINIYSCHSAVSFHSWCNPSFYVVPSDEDLMFHVLSPSHVSALTFFTSLTTHTSLSSVFFKVLAGMNVHPAEFDGLKQEYNVKGYPTFCYFE